MTYNEVSKLFAMGYSYSGNRSHLQASLTAYELLSKFDMQVTCLGICWVAHCSRMLLAGLCPPPAALASFKSTRMCAGLWRQFGRRRYGSAAAATPSP